MPPKRTKKKQQQGVSNQPGPSDAVNDAERHDLLEELQRIGDIFTIQIPPKPELATQGSSLLITHIDVVDFKSYSGKQTIGPFHHALSCIIGPNGSGKSNVIDSLLFVLGFRSNRIRAPKATSFIHHSAKRAADSCSVIVHFKLFSKDSDDPTHGQLLDTFSIGRTVHSNKQSKYNINGRPADCKDVQRKLKNVGVDLDHNRFLILQGEVEQISLMKPKAEKEGEEGMLEYLDDIIGTSRYCKPIKLFSLTMENVGNEREAQMNKVNCLEMERQNLSEPVRELLTLLVLENKISALKNKLFSLKKIEYSRRAGDIEPKIVEAQNSLDEKKNELEQLLTQIKEQKKSMSKHQRDLDKQKLSIADVEKRLSEETLRLQKYDLTSNKTNARKVEKEKEIVKEEKKISTLTDRPERNNAEIEELKIELETVITSIEEKEPLLQEKLAESQQRTAEINQERTKVGDKLAEARKKEDEANAELTLAQSRRIAMTEEVERYERRLASAKEMTENAKEKIATKQKEKEALEKRNPLIEKEMKDAQALMETLKKKEPKLANEHSKLQEQYDAATANISNDQRNNKVLSMLMREKANGNIPGLVGRLGNLGAIDPKYDAAISTTCAGLDMLVCDSFETIKLCLKFIEENKLGRTSFIAFDKIQHLKDKMQQIDTPENHPRLFDLVKCNNDDVRLAYYFCLRDALIVDDIVTARRVSTLWKQKKFRVVTLDGEIVDISGSLTGGGNAVKRGRIGTNVQAMASTENPENLLPQLREKKALLDELHNEIATLQEKVDAKARELDQGKGELKRCLQSLEIAKSELSSNEKAVRELTKKLAETNVNEDELQKAAKLIEELEGRRNNLTEVADKINRDYDEITKRIDAIYEEISGRLQKEVNEKKARRDEITTKITSLRTAASKAEIDLRKSKDKLENMQKLIVDMDEELANLEEEKAKTQEDIDGLNALLEEKKTQFEEIKVLMDEAQAANNGVDEREVNLKKDIANAMEEVAKLKAEARLAEAKVDDINTKIQKLKTYDIKEILCDKTLAKDKKASTKNKKKAAKVTVADSNDGHSSDSDISSSDEEEDPVSRATTPVIPSQQEAVTIDPNDPNCGILRTYCEADVAEFNSDAIQVQLNSLENERAGIEVAMNLNLIETYREKLHECRSEYKTLIEVTERRDRIRKHLDAIKRARVEEFMEGFMDIALSLKEQYQKLTMGGDADLELVDPMDPYSEGIKFCVRPRGKGWRPMQLTSGGEKTLSSLSLVFALHHFRPTPFYVMDEIDAALDARNVMLIAHFVKERAESAQFIIISLREQMFNLAARLIGIFKINDCTQNAVISGNAIKDEVNISLDTLNVSSKQKKKRLHIHDSPDAVRKKNMKKVK